MKQSTFKILTALILALMFISIITIPTIPNNEQIKENPKNNEQFGVNPQKNESFQISTDGVESPYSVNSFSKTSDNDVALDPDSDTNLDFSKAEWGTAESLTDDTLFYPDSEFIYKDEGDNPANWVFQGGIPATADHRDISTIAEGEDGTSIEISGLFDSAPVDYQCYGLNLSAAYGGSGIPTGNGLSMSIRWKTNSSTQGGRIMLKFSDTSNQYIVDPPASQSTWVTTTALVNYGAAFVSTIWVWSYEIDYGTGLWFSTIVDWISFYVGPCTNSTGDGVNSGFVDSFNNVADWVYSGGGTSGTDGDVAYFDISAGGYRYYYTNSPSAFPAGSYYAEARMKLNGSTGTCYGSIAATSGDSVTGTGKTMIGSWYLSTSFETRRAFVTITLPTECFYISFKDASNNQRISIEYLRISPTDEVGWQHDASLTTGISSTDGGTIASNGDLLTLTSDADGSTFEIVVDTTTTAAYLSCTYYPFFAISVTSISSGDGWKLEQYDGAAWAWLESTYVTVVGLNHYNMKSMDTYVEKFRINLTTTASVIIDYMKAYDMINWSLVEVQTNYLTTAVVYFDNTEDSIVMEKTFDASADHIIIDTINTTIGYEVKDMVMLATVKASANLSVNYYPSVLTSGSDPTVAYHITDQWQQIALPFGDCATLQKIRLIFQNWVAATPSSGSYRIYIKNNITIRPSWYDASAETGTYAESFSDDSDWALQLNEASDSKSSNGDVLSFKKAGDATDDIDELKSQTGLGLSQSYYVEFRYWFNSTTFDYAQVLLYDSTGTKARYTNLVKTTVATTFKSYIMGSLMAGSTASFDIDYIILRIQSDSGQSVNYQMDYIRIAPADEMGYQDDCSSITADTSYRGDGTYETDGDIVRFWNDDSIYDKARWTLPMIRQSYYPFLEIRLKTAHAAQFNIYDESSNRFDYNVNTNGLWATVRINVDALMTSGSYISSLQIYDGTVNDQEFWVDYIQFYSIAYWTLTQANCESTDLLYIDSTKLYCSSLTSDANEYFLLDYDPAISVDGDLYTVYNVTTDMNDNSDEFYFYHYVGAVSSGALDNTRGPTLSGTITDMKFRFNGKTTAASTRYVSEIKFIEDNTAPIIENFWTVPYTPNEEDDISLVVFTTDGTGVGAYSVTFNAIDYPSSFVDIDYEASESSGQSGLWQVTIPAADVVAGYYAFGVSVTDGANVATDFEVFRVTTIYLQITDIVLITATPSLAQISGHSNKDCSYQIYENDTLQGSGSVADGWFSISWTKDTTAGAFIELGIKFYVSIYTDWINGSYSVASAAVLQITDPSYSSTSTYNHLSGTASLSCNYYTYDNNSLQTSGSITAGSFEVSWAKLSTTGVHNWAVKFIDGITTRWINGSYEVSSTTFDVQNDHLWTDDTTAHLGGYINMAANVTIYEDGVLIGTANITQAGGFEIQWVKASSTVANVTVLFESGTQEFTCYHGYTVVAQVNLALEIWTVVIGDNYITVIFKTTLENTTLYICNNGTLVDSVTETSTGASITIAKPTAIGFHNITGYIDAGSSSMNVSILPFTVSANYGWSYVSPYFPSGTGYELSSFQLWINGSRIRDRDWKFYGRTDSAYEVVVKDYFGTVLYNSTFAWDRNIDVLVPVYEFSISHMLYASYITFVMTSPSGATWSTIIHPNMVAHFFLHANQTYSYSYAGIFNATPDATPEYKVYTGSVYVDQDKGLVIVSWGLEKVLEWSRTYQGGGGITPQQLLEALSTFADERISPVQNILIIVCLIAIVIVIILILYPSKTTIISSSSGRTQSSSTQVPKQSQSHSIQKGENNPKRARKKQQ